MTNNPEDRDLLIRVDSDLKNLSSRMKDATDSHNKHSARTESLAESLQQLTYNVGALVKSMEKAEAGLTGIAAHEIRICRLEETLIYNEKAIDECNTSLKTITVKIDRISFLGKCVAWVIGSPAAIAICILALQFLQKTSL